MSGVSLITAEIDQAFEACSASAVLPAWKHMSLSLYESRFLSNSVLVHRVVVSDASLGGHSHMVGDGFSFSTPVMARAPFSFTSVSLVMLGSMVWQIWSIPIGGVMSSTAVAVVLGAAELVWLNQQQKHSELGFHFLGRPIRNCISWKRYVDDVVVGSRVFCCSCIFVFIRACYPVPLSLVSGAGPAVHTWVDVELRANGQHVAVNIKSPNRSWVHARGPQQKSTFLPWTGVLKGGLGCIRGVVLGHLARTKMLGLSEQFAGGSSPGRHCGIGVLGVSSVCHSGLGPFFAL